MPFTNSGKHSMLNAITGKAAAVAITHASLHSADPGLTGANEIASGGYARVAMAAADWAAAAAGEIATAVDKTFAGPASGACTHFGTWNATTFLGGGTLTGDQAFNAAGAYVLKTGTKLTIT